MVFNYNFTPLVEHSLYVLLYLCYHVVKWWMWYDCSAANSCPASPRGGHGHGRRNVTSDLQMVAAYAAAAVAGGGSSGSLHSVMNTITVASSSSMEDRFVLKSHSGPNFYNIAFVYYQLQVFWSQLNGKWWKIEKNVLLVLETENCNKDKPTITAITQWDESPYNSGNLLASNCLKPVICAMQKINGILWRFVLLSYVNCACIFVTDSIC